MACMMQFSGQDVTGYVDVLGISCSVAGLAPKDLKDQMFNEMQRFRYKCVSISFRLCRDEFSLCLNALTFEAFDGFYFMNICISMQCTSVI